MAVALTQTQRNQLFSLSQTTSLLELTARRVNTGKKINDASDNPFLYFKSTRLSQNADIFNAISSELETSLNVVKAAESGLTNIRTQLLTVQSRLRDALAAGNQGTPGLTGQKAIAGDPLLYTTLTLQQAFGIDATDKLQLKTNAKIAGVNKAKTFLWTGATTIATLLNDINSNTVELGNATLGENLRADITAQGGLRIVATGSDPQNDTVTNLQFTFTDVVKNNQGLFNIFGSAVPQYTTPPTPAVPAGTLFLDTGQITANFNQIRAEGAQFLTNTLQEIAAIATDSAFAGNNLLQGGNLSVFLNETGTSSLSIIGVDLTNGKLGLNLGFSTAANGEFIAATGLINPALPGILQSDAGLNTTLGRISGALDQVEYYTRQISGNLDIIKNRIGFSKEIANVFQASSDQIVAADVNEESANLIALQTRQQLALQALSVTNQAQQGALRLF